LTIVMGIPLFASLVSKKTLPAQIDVLSIFLSLSVAVTVGIVFGWYPAHRASRLEPIEAVRHN
jgi:putative ABC transport system permease protein